MIKVLYKLLHKLVFKYVSFTNRVQPYTSLHKLQVLQPLRPELEWKWKRLHFTTSTPLPKHNQSDRFLQPVRPACKIPLREYRSDRSTDRSDWSQQNCQGAHPAHRCVTRQTSNLGVSIHHFPPLCISADEFDAAGTEVNVRVSCNKN